MSASAKDLPDADLENLIREKHRQALAEPGIGRPARAAPEAPRSDLAASPSMRLGAGSLGGPTLAIDPSDRVLPAAGRSRGSLVPIAVIVVAVAVVAAVVAWTRQGSGDFAIFSSPTTEPGLPGTDRGMTAENKPPVAPGSMPQQQAAPAQQIPAQPAPAQTAPAVQQAAPAQPAPPAQPVAPVQAAPVEQAAPAQPAAPVQQAEKKEEAPVQQKAPEKKTVKPAEKKQAAEKKTVKPAEKPKQAAAKPKPAATDEGDASFSTLLNSLTTEAPQETAAPAPANTQPAVQQPAAQPKSTEPLPTSTAPSTPGTQLFQ